MKISPQWVRDFVDIDVNYHQLADDLTLAGIAVESVSGEGDGTIFEANRPQLTSIEVPLSRLAESWDGFRIAQLSDFHYDEYFSVEPLRKAIDIVNRLQPDLVVLTGDFVTSPVRKPRRLIAAQAAKAIEPCVQLLVQLHARSLG